MIFLWDECPTSVDECIDGNMGWAVICGVMAPHSREIGKITRSMALVFPRGPMADTTRANGKRTIWMGWVFIIGQMVASIRASTRKIRSTALVC